MLSAFRLTALVLVLASLFTAADDKPSAPELENSKPLAPKDERDTFQLIKGFKIELVTAEPNLIDPVSMSFDERGRMFVCEMRGYPNGGVGGGTITSGRIRLLEDRDHDGVYETAHVFAEGLRFPMASLPWGKGVLVAVAPELVYLEDADGDGKAEKKTVLYTGFDLANIQQLVNGLTWGLDGWVYGLAGSAGGTVKSAQKPDLPAVTLRGRGFRFRPDVPGSLEPTSGGGQYGLTRDAWGHWFVSTNSQHLRHIVLPDHALRRNPSLPVRATTLDIAEHGAACKVFRVSPFEKWRVERTRRRAGSPDAPRFATTELVPGGFVTSGTSPLLYDAELFPKEYRGSVFVCDPANNLILRDVLSDNGATYIARRGHEDREFLASTDNWFRPTWLTHGPEGALYVLDFYREVIETPLSLPEDIKKRLNLESRGRGRIWRIAPDGTPPFKDKPALHKANSAQLVKLLGHDNTWWRTTAQRLLLERRPSDAGQPLLEMLRRGTSAPGRALALWTLQRLELLNDETLVAALKDAEPGVREQALRIVEERLPQTPTLLKPLGEIVNDPSPRVRFQLAVTLGASDAVERLPLLAALLRQRDSDSWTQTAVLSSVGKQGDGLLLSLIDEGKKGGLPARSVSTAQALASLVGSSADDAELSRVFAKLTAGDKPVALWEVELLTEIGNGLQARSRALAGVRDRSRLQPIFDFALRIPGNSSLPHEDQASATKLLAHVPFREAKPVFERLLTPQTPTVLQLAAIRAAAPMADQGVAPLLLSRWSEYTPTVRRECTEALFARPERLLVLLDAVDKKQVLVNHLEPARLLLLKSHRDANVKARAEKVLAGAVAPARQKIIDAYKAALELKTNREAGKAAFKKTCATCHRLENVGHQVGADLLAALKNKTREQLLIDIFDPSREVDPRFQNYLVTTTKGSSLSGLLATETASSLTLKRGEGAEDVLLRSQIEEIKATGLSLMPDNLESQLSKQEVADLIEYLLAVGGGMR